MLLVSIESHLLQCKFWKKQRKSSSSNVPWKLIVSYALGVFEKIQNPPKVKHQLLGVRLQYLIYCEFSKRSGIWYIFFREFRNKPDWKNTISNSNSSQHHNFPQTLVWVKYQKNCILDSPQLKKKLHYKCASKFNINWFCFCF